MTDASTDLVFYDGGCGLCHRAVRFLVARDEDGTRFEFAPLEGSTFGQRIGADRARLLPDSLLVLTGDGELLARSRGVIRVLARLGRGWRTAARVAGWMPTPLLDRLYDGVAAVRHRLFEAPTDVCPAVPPPLRGRFLP
jgi:predicted DCC family thiol-disulfide oxidoreductase YuxK